MSMNNRRLAAATSSLAAGAVVTLAALLLLVGTPALGAPITYSSGGSPYVGTTVTIPDIVDTGDAPPALAPVLTNTGTDFAYLNLLGSGTFSTMASSTSSSAVSPSDAVLDFDVLGNVTQGTRNAGLGVVTKGYAITGLSLDLQGLAEYLGNRSNSNGTVISGADFSMEVTEVNFQSITPLQYDFSFPTFTHTFTGATSGSQAWNVGGSITGTDWDDLKTFLGLAATDYITGIRFNTFNAGLTSSVFRGMTSNTVNQFELTASTQLVAVPEPPTVILAGFGVAAAVANGVRRRLRRRNGAAESGDATVEGDVALSA